MALLLEHATSDRTRRRTGLAGPAAYVQGVRSAPCRRRRGVATTQRDWSIHLRWSATEREVERVVERPTFAAYGEGTSSTEPLELEGGLEPGAGSADQTASTPAGRRPPVPWPGRLRRATSSTGGQGNPGRCRRRAGSRRPSPASRVAQVRRDVAGRDLDARVVEDAHRRPHQARRRTHSTRPARAPRRRRVATRWSDEQLAQREAEARGRRPRPASRAGAAGAASRWPGAARWRPRRCPSRRPRRRSARRHRCRLDRRPVGSAGRARRHRPRVPGRGRPARRTPGQPPRPVSPMSPDEPTIRARPSARS